MKLGHILFGLTFTLAGCAHPGHQVHQMGPKTHSLRLKPDQDVRLELEKFTTEHHLQAAVIASAVGSLKQYALRFANQKEITKKQGHFEIVSLQGTLSPDGPHLHLSVSDEKGTTTGGHLAEGNLIYTTLELTILEIEDTKFSRQLDPATGSKELQIQSQEN